MKGHQDKDLPEKDLDRWSLLNIEVDKLAKSVVNSWVENLENQQVEGEPWAIWSNAVKLINDFDSKLYEILQSKSIEEYWIKKKKFPNHQTSNIHWEAIGKAMKEAPLERRRFITKHAAGMCGVGKFMKLWGERETDTCPRCGAMENASHVWICPQLQAAISTET